MELLLLPSQHTPRRAMTPKKLPVYFGMYTLISGCSSSSVFGDIHPNSGMYTKINPVHFDRLEIDKLWNGWNVFSFPRLYLWWNEGIAQFDNCIYEWLKAFIISWLYLLLAQRFFLSMIVFMTCWKIFFKFDDWMKTFLSLTSIFMNGWKLFSFHDFIYE